MFFIFSHFILPFVIVNSDSAEAWTLISMVGYFTVCPDVGPYARSTVTYYMRHPRKGMLQLDINSPFF